MERIVSLLGGLSFLSVTASQHQFTFFPTPKNWYDAKIYCRKNCLDLATIYYMEEMNEVLPLIKVENDAAVWFGFKQGYTRSWHWSLTGKDFYKEGEEEYLPWGADQKYHCGFYKERFLYTLACNNTLPFICFDATKKGEDQYVMVADAMGWTGALNYCKATYTGLTSLRNHAELEIIQNLVSNNSVWVGLFRDSWVWSDESDSSFRNWPPGVSVWSNSVDSCGALLKNESGRVGALDCTETHPFLCSCLPDTSHMYFKVKLTPQNPGLDINNPAVQDSILEQLKMKLKLRGTTAEGVQLQWRKQSNSNIFEMKTP